MPIPMSITRDGRRRTKRHCFNFWFSSLIQTFSTALTKDVVLMHQKENEATHQAEWSRASLVPDGIGCHGDPNHHPIIEHHGSCIGCDFLGGLKIHQSIYEDGAIRESTENPLGLKIAAVGFTYSFFLQLRSLVLLPIKEIGSHECPVYSFYSLRETLVRWIS